ncbi:RRM domain-containing protein [Haematococcus lacustris]|uniref:RRM domain-containing protein n=1 Tax=Haematococcus lacustris TaxID=44745 RepID=A0A699YGA0_HAELA|nr:RRM domain-containing protein [Haematococcus lacustris]
MAGRQSLLQEKKSKKQGAVIPSAVEQASVARPPQQQPEDDGPALDEALQQDNAGSGSSAQEATAAAPVSSEHGSAGAFPQQRKSKSKVLTAEKLKRIKADYDKRGASHHQPVLPLPRIPPHMKPMKLKQLLSVHGEVLRVYCTPEDSGARRLRKQKGGNTGKNFTEGWVEFADKRIAKRTALALNGQQIGGKRRSAYYEDLWCLKYLKHFKWDHLTEDIAYQNAVREQRMAAEVSAAKRERDHYLAQVDKAKAQTAIAARKAAKATVGNGGFADEGAQSADHVAAAPTSPTVGDAGLPSQAKAFVRHFGQRKAKPEATEEGITTMSDDVLALIAHKRKKPRLA